MEQKSIEGITPDMLWIFFLVLIGLCGMIVLIGKTVDVLHVWQEKRKAPSPSVQEGLNDIKAKIAIHENALSGVDEKLDRDKRRIDGMEKSMGSTEQGFKVLCESVLALLNHQLHNGNAVEMENAAKNLNTYLINR